MTITGKQVLASTLTVLGVGAMTIIPASADEYTVKQGDTVSELAQHFNTTAEQITKDSKLADSNSIFIGEKLEITMNKKDTETKIVVPEVKQVTPVQPVEVSTPTPSQPVQEQPKQEVVQPTTATTVNTGNAVEYASQRMSQATGVSQAQWYTVIMRESGGNVNITNPTGHFGLFQISPIHNLQDTSVDGQINKAIEIYKAQGGAGWQAW